jgi:hypothetical protein
VNAFLFAALLYPAVLAAPNRGKLDLADRTELRGGYFGFPTDPSLTLETVPSATLGLATRRSHLTLGYAPRLGFADMQLGVNPYALHVGMAGVGWHDRRLTLSLDENASYGFLNFSSLQLPAAATGGATVRVDPQLRRRIFYEASTTTFTAIYAFRHTWALRFLASYALSGGADQEARNVLPFQSGPRAELAFDYGLARTQRLITSVSIEQTSIEPSSFSAGFDYLFLQASQGYKHAFSRRTNAEISAGAAEVRTTRPIPESRSHFETYPVGLFVFVHEAPFRDKLDFRFAGQLGPIVNRITGRLAQQGQGLLKATWRRRKWTTVFDAGYAFPLAGDAASGFSLVSGQLALGYAFTKHVLFEVGASVAWQKVGDFEPITRRLAFVAVTARYPTLQF